MTNLVSNHPNPFIALTNAYQWLTTGSTRQGSHSDTITFPRIDQKLKTKPDFPSHGSDTIDTQDEVICNKKKMVSEPREGKSGFVLSFWSIIGKVAVGLSVIPIGLSPMLAYDRHLLGLKKGWGDYSLGLSICY